MPLKLLPGKFNGPWGVILTSENGKRVRLIEPCVLKVVVNKTEGLEGKLSPVVSGKHTERTFKYGLVEFVMLNLRQAIIVYFYCEY